MKLNLNKFVLKCINSFETEQGEANMWGQPLTTLLSAEHPLISELKQMVSPEHFFPAELLPDAKSIVIFFIPFDSRIIESNLLAGAASIEWARTYILTNQLLSRINDELEKYIIQHDFKAEKVKPTHNFSEETLMSRWSHRHLAWIAGMGTFGINNMLITSKGCCGRFGSLVTNADMMEFGFSTDDSKVEAFQGVEKCLNKRNGSCGICQKKCPVGAYKEGGVFDRHKCYKVCLENAQLYKEIGLADACGKCLVGLPCSSKDPSK